jgi:hypothetical protein
VADPEGRDAREVKRSDRGWHELKTWPPYFARVLDGTKTFEIRKEDGRRFAVGDVLWMREHTGIEYTGRAIRKRVGYIFRWDDEVSLPFLTEGTVVMGLIHDGPCDVQDIIPARLVPREAPQ